MSQLLKSFEEAEKYDGTVNVRYLGHCKISSPSARKESLELAKQEAFKDYKLAHNEVLMANRQLSLLIIAHIKARMGTYTCKIDECITVGTAWQDYKNAKAVATVSEQNLSARFKTLQELNNMS
jgi:hypothetical protein